eukprot:2200903-Rhodomonas_salina.5
MPWLVLPFVCRISTCYAMSGTALHVPYPHLLRHAQYSHRNPYAVSGSALCVPYKHLLCHVRYSYRSSYAMSGPALEALPLPFLVLTKDSLCHSGTHIGFLFGTHKGYAATPALRDARH